MRGRALLAFLLVASLAGTAADVRTEGIDFIILMDTSLSMVGPIEDAKRYAAGEIVGRLVEQGDWVALVRFYGKSETIWKGEINTGPDMAALIRSLNLLEADGRFTDIGLALDFVDTLILERGHPERPKYILLLTDERQEAPKDTKYYSQDYTIAHPLLEYIKRVDMGGFRLITVGYGLAARIEGSARALVTTLASPPETREVPLAGSDAAKDQQSGDKPEAGEATSNAPANTGDTGSRFLGLPPVVLAAAFAALALAVVLVIFLAARRRRRAKDEDPKKPVELDR
jgi:hypothetical protein